MAPSPGNGTGAFPHFAQFGLSACFQVLIQPPEFIENSGKNIRRQRHPFEKLFRLQNCRNSAREKIMFLLQAVRISEVELWCAKGDLNPHALRHRNLNPGRLPFRHSRVRRLTIALIAAFRNREGGFFHIFSAFLLENPAERCIVKKCVIVSIRKNLSSYDRYGRRLPKVGRTRFARRHPHSG